MSLFGDYVRNANSIAQSRISTAEQLAETRGSMYQAEGESNASTLMGAAEENQMKMLNKVAEKYGMKTGAKTALELLQRGARSVGPGIQKAGDLLDSASSGAEYLAKSAVRKLKGPPAPEEIEMQDLTPEGDIKGAANDLKTNAAPRSSTTADAGTDSGAGSKMDFNYFEDVDSAEPGSMIKAPQERVVQNEAFDPGELNDHPGITQEDIPEGAGGGPEPGRLGPQKPMTEEEAGRFTQEKDPLSQAADEEDVSDIAAKSADAEKAASQAAESAAEKAAAKAGEQATEEAGEMAGKSLAEMAGEAGGALAGFIGDAIPILGIGADIYTLVSSGVDFAKEMKDDPMDQARTQINQANQKMAQMSAKISTEQFQQRIGAQMPSFGSLAAAGAKAQQQVALHY